jgi:hypothetical protein
LTIRQKIEIAAFLALLWAVGAMGCVPQTPAQDALFDCRVEALKPSCGAALDASELVRDAVLGRVDIVGTLLRLGNTRAQVAEALQRLDACEPLEAPAPVLELPVRAPPPAYGNKVL